MLQRFFRWLRKELTGYDYFCEGCGEGFDRFFTFIKSDRTLCPDCLVSDFEERQHNEQKENDQ